MCDVCLGRRGLMLGGTGLAAATALRRLVPAARADAAAPGVAPDQALQMLLDGNGRYAANHAMARDDEAGRAALAKGQRPFAALLGCADSRVSPEIAFDQGPGKLFVTRVAGNFVTDEGLGTLEYGAAVLGIRLAMVLGHSACGAVAATVDALRTGARPPGHIGGLVDALKPGIAPAMDGPAGEVVPRAVIANVRHNVARLQQATPILAGMVADGRLRIVGAVYHLDTGKVALV